MASDFLSDEDFAPQITQGRDFLEDDFPQEKPKESYGKSLGMAIPRMIADMWHGGINAAKNIPNDLDYLGKELSGLPQTAKEHPNNLNKQALAGFAELGQKIFNTPHDIANYATNRLNLIPEDINQKIQMGRMPDSEEDINSLLGKPENPGESLIRSVFRNAETLTGAGRLASIANPLKYTDKAIVKDVLKTGEENKKIYNKKYNNLFDQASNKGFDDALNNVDIDMNTLNKYTPKKKMIGVTNFNEDPTLKNAHKAKSDLLKLQDTLSKKTSLNEGEKTHLNAISDAIDSLKSNMFKDKNGNVNNKFVQKYNDISRGYATDVVPYKDKAINQYKKEARTNKSGYNQGLANKQLVKELKNNRFAIQRGAAHPELVNQALMQKALLAAGLGSGGLYGGNMLYNKIYGQNSQK